jgi:cell division protein FtsZ
LAEQGIAELRQHVDSLIVIPNDRLPSIAPKNAKLIDMFKRVDDVLYAAVRGISDLVIIPGYINLDFADVHTAMAESGYAMMGAGRAWGENRAVEAAKMAINSPLLEDISIAGAKAVFINITATSDISMDEYNEATQLIQETAHGENGDGHIFIGMAFDENAGEEMRVTVIATGIDHAGHSQTVLTASGARVTTLGGRGGFVQAAPQDAKAKNPLHNLQPAGEAKPLRHVYAATATTEPFESPTYLRLWDKETSRHANRYTPGGEEHCGHNEEEPELPSFIRLLGS